MLEEGKEMESDEKVENLKISSPNFEQPNGTSTKPVIPKFSSFKPPLKPTPKAHASEGTFHNRAIY
jgi:hypothetical protein